MKILKKYSIVISIALPVLLLIVIKTYSATGFKNDAKRWSMPSFNGSNVVSTTEIGTLSGDKLIINLDNSNAEELEKSIPTVNISSEVILTRKFLKTIRKHQGPCLLFSADPAMSAKMWMIISQTGVKNIYILTNEKDNEIFKNKFRPDSLTRPEFHN